MDSVKAASAVSPLSEHGGFGGGDDDVATAQPQLSPAGMRLLSPASARGTGAAREDEPPPVLVRAPPQQHSGRRARAARAGARHPAVAGGA